MQTQEELRAQFASDIDRISNDFINLYGLKYEQEAPNLSNPLLRWLDFVLRYIPPTPRTIYKSNRFPVAPDQVTADALAKIENAICHGIDINPYQSKGLILHNDTSGDKRQRRTDLLWAEWGIHHLHLSSTEIPSGTYFSQRSNWLLFCIAGDDFICFIDIKNHGEPDLFSNPSLIEAVAESWPEMMAHYKLNGILPSETTRSPSDIAALRKGGVSSFIHIGSHVYMGPGMGITTASTPTKISMSTIRISQYLEELSKIVADPESQFKMESYSSGTTNPIYSLALTKNGLSIYEKNENKAFVFPRYKQGGVKSFLAELHDLVAPEWAIKRMVQVNP